MNIIPHIPQGINILYVSLLVLLGIYVYFVQRNSGLLYAMISEVFSPHPFVKIKNYSTSGTTVSLLIICNFSFFLYEVLHYKIIPFLPQTDLHWCFLIIAICYLLVRYILLWVSFLFGEEQFGITILQFFQVYGLFFLLFSVPVMLFIQYFSISVAVLALEILIAAGFLLWLVCILRCIIMGRTLTRFSVLHIFLYLCTLQIFPISIFFKLITLYAAN
ncbi:MAG: DUF4271 domain-containing protein [Bacteroidales bacterium]|jgi:hypothetical protein|nr:DUF4271 domain-containing protein [Bacteroidales bacterium]